jgi:hypothetical protein
VQRWFGGGLYSGNYFPTVDSMQEQVFKKSFSGHYITNYLGTLLIDTTPSSSNVKKKPKKPVIHMGN